MLEYGSPATEALKGTGKGGVVPPAEHRWKPGQSGNPGGAPVGQSYPGRWLDTLGELPASELERIFGDENASISKRAAARLLLDTINGERPGDRHRALAELLDRTQGRARQHVDQRVSGGTAHAHLHHHQHAPPIDPAALDALGEQDRETLVKAARVMRTLRQRSGTPVEAGGHPQIRGESGAEGA